VFWEVVALGCVRLGSHYYLWKYSFNEGLVQGCEVALEELEIEKLIKVDDDGKIWQWDQYLQRKSKNR
jgi:hypothetical protein